MSVGVAAVDDRQIVTVDIVLMTILAGRLMVGLIKREAAPFEGRAALIGGYVRSDEDVDIDATAVRVLAQKTSLTGFYVEQLATFSGRDRDPRGWSVSVAYFALTHHEALRIALGAEPSVVLRPVEDVGDLPFDHHRILQVAVDRLRGKGAYSTLPARLLPQAFTLGELQEVYRIALGVARIDKSSFRRKLTELSLLEPVEGKFAETGGRRAQLYRLKREYSVFARRL